MSQREQKLAESNLLLESESQRSNQSQTNSQLRPPKLNNFMAFLMLYKSCVGIGVFTFPFAFSKVGAIWGSLLSASVCYATTYGMYIMTSTSDDISTLTSLNRIDYQSVCNHVSTTSYGTRIGSLIGDCATLGVILMNVAIIDVSIVSISNHVDSLTSIDTIVIKILILIVYMIISIFAIYPQQLKVFGFIASAVCSFILVAMIVDNAEMIAQKREGQTVQVELANFANTGLFLGIAGSIFESASTIFSIRNAMRRPQDLPLMTIWGLTSIGVFYTLICLSFYYAYGKDNILSFLLLFYPPDTKPAYYAFGLVFCMALILFFPMYNISNSEILQERPWFKNMLQTETGEISTVKLVLFRWLLLILSAAPALITNRVELIVGFSGSLVAPLISFYLPVAVRAMHDQSKGRPVRILTILHDIVILIFATAITVFGFLAAFNEARSK